MHPPPEKPPVDRQIKRVAKQMLLNNMKPVQIEKELVLSTDPISARYLPTRRQLVNMNTYLRSRYLPSPNALNNIIAMYHDNFLIQLTLYPNFVIILGAPEAKQLFQFYGRTIFIDGTFDLCEEKVVLTTIMLSIGELGVPAFFFMLSDSRSSRTYQLFLRQLKEFVDNTYDPENVFGDYETAIHEAIRVVFPNARYFGDSFHFMQANVRWLRKNKIQPETQKDVITSLRLLWTSPTREEFHQNLQTLLTKWQHNIPEYSKYFETVWLKENPPVMWAYFARAAKNLPSGIYRMHALYIKREPIQYYSFNSLIINFVIILEGDHKLEGWHNRLQNWIMPSHQDAIDHVVTNLRNEWIYYHRIIQSPDLFQSVFCLLVLSLIQ
jgi:hypothetical protein